MRLGVVQDRVGPAAGQVEPRGILNLSGAQKLGIAARAIGTTGAVSTVAVGYARARARARARRKGKELLPPNGSVKTEMGRPLGEVAQGFPVEGRVSPFL